MSQRSQRTPQPRPSGPVPPPAGAVTAANAGSSPPNTGAPQPEGAAPAASAKPLPVREALMRVVQPLADGLVRRLTGTRVAPHHVVLTHTAIGLLAAWLLAGGAWLGWLAAAVLLQVKSLLDNADGGLARATGRVTRMGRYLDTLMDLVVNAALFVALAQHGPGWLALLAFVALTLVLSTEFNAMRRHLEEHAEQPPALDEAPPGAPPGVLALLEGAYDTLLAPQDRLLRYLDARWFERADGAPWPHAAPSARRRWADTFSVATLVNLGLTTQMLLLGICAAVGLPYAYVVLVLLQVPYVLALQALRLRRYRAAVRP